MPFVIGREAVFSYTGGPEGTVITTKFSAVAFEEERKMWPTTPPGYLMKRYTPGIMEIRGILEFWYDSTDPTPSSPGSPLGSAGAPSATPTGTLVITLTSGKTKTFKASLFSLSCTQSMVEGGPPTVLRYGFVGNAQSTSDTIVTA